MFNLRIIVAAASDKLVADLFRTRAMDFPQLRRAPFGCDRAFEHLNQLSARPRSHFDVP
jgi:hypothetical protein